MHRLPQDAQDPIEREAARHVARLRDGVVILDSANDSYSGLYVPGPGSDLMPPGETGAETLSTLGLADLAACAAPIASFEDRPHWQDLAVDAPAPLRACDIGHVLVALLQTSLAFRLRSFERLLSEQQHAPSPAGTLADYQAAIARFERMRLILPIPMLCLFRSHLLLLFLRRAGLPANWVFGVSLFPFHAHCWLAVGDRLLGERSDRTQDLVPIRVISNAMGDAA